MNPSAAMDYAERSAEMLDDPDLYGRPLALGLALLLELTVRRDEGRRSELDVLERRPGRARGGLRAVVDADPDPEPDPYAWTRRSVWFRAATLAAGPPKVHPWTTADPRAWPAYWLQGAIRDDVPRYEGDRGWNGDHRCPYLRLRPPGAVCGQRTTQSQFVPDPLTGETHYARSCYRHRDALHADRNRLWAEWREHGSPRPAADTGGILARYFDIDWPRIYRWVRPDWKPVELRPPTSPRPRLSLVPPLED